MMRWRVVWALALMMLKRSPTNRFIKVLLPTLGEPTMFTKPARWPSCTGCAALAWGMGGRGALSDTADIFEVQRYGSPRESAWKPPPALADGKTLCTLAVRCRRGHDSGTKATEPHRGVEQLVARRAHNPKVAGSSPAPATKKTQESAYAGSFVFIPLKHSVYWLKQSNKKYARNELYLRS